MNIFGSSNNIFVGFDMQNNNIKLMRAGKVTEGAEVEYLHFKSRIFTDEFFEEANALLAEYFQKKPSFLNLPVYVVLPDQAVGLETFNLPNLARSKQMQAFDTELANLYEGRQKDWKINRFPLAQNKQYSTFGAVYFDKRLIGRIYKLLTDVRLFPRQTTYSGNALLNSVFNFAPRLRGKSFVFADMHLDYTEIAVSSKGKTLGVATIPHGTDLLKTDKVELEYMRTDHEVGELAVINAREVARAKALTLSGEDEPDLSVIPEGATIEDYAVDSQAQSDYSGTAPKSAISQEEGSAPASAAQPQVSAPAEGEAVAEGAAGTQGAPAEGDAADEFYESEEDEERRLAELAKEKLKKVKVYRKMPKRYPKFMVRETPDDPEGIQYENFRIIMKWILLYARQAELSEYTASPEFIVVNMPSETAYLLDRSNDEHQDGLLQFRPFTAADKLPAEIKGNLNLYGCLFARHFNKNHNF